LWLSGHEASCQRGGGAAKRRRTLSIWLAPVSPMLLTTNIKQSEKE